MWERPLQPRLLYRSVPPPLHSLIGVERGGNPSVVDFEELTLSLDSSYNFLNSFEGKMRGDLNLLLHQSKSSLIDGNMLDLDLQLFLWISFFVLRPLFPIRFCSFGGIWE
jgi:hypothetical protein